MVTSELRAGTFVGSWERSRRRHARQATQGLAGPETPFPGSLHRSGNVVANQELAAVSTAYSYSRRTNTAKVMKSRVRALGNATTEQERGQTPHTHTHTPKILVFIGSSALIGCPQRQSAAILATTAQSQIQIKLKVISSQKRAQQRERVRSCVCLPVGQARGNGGFSLMYEKIVLYHGKSQLAVSF